MVKMNEKMRVPLNLRLGICAMVLLLSGAALYALYPRFVSQIHYLLAREYHKDVHLGLASHHYKKAGSYQPRNAIIWKKLAEAQLSMGKKKKVANEALFHTLKAKDSYLRASQHNPLDAETYYGIASAEVALRQIYKHLHPEENSNPYQPLPFFEKAIHLRPNCIPYHYAMARYLYLQDNDEAFLRIIRSLARMYPPVYSYLKKEPLWSPSTKEAVKHGVLEAIRQRILLGSAHMTMFSILAEDKEWPEAIVHYKKALELKKGEISGRDYITLGRLYLHNRQVKDAEINFIKGLYMSEPIEKALKAVSRIYRDSGYLDDFFSFYQEIRQRFIFSPDMHVISAQHMIDLKQYRKAQRILKSLNGETPTASAYYWLARIAELEKDWDSMELAIQKATVLDPSNINYRKVFLGLLKRLGKHATAEREIGLMIQYSDKPSPRLFDERAILRWEREDYLGAAEDWKSAVLLNPKQDSFYANIAEAYIKLGDLHKAIEYYQKAMMLNPGNSGYAEKYKMLKGQRL
jgi:tetratricopeptide (TPR) repeat protein